MNADEIQAGRQYWAAVQGQEVQVTTLKPAMSVRDGWICSRAPKSDWLVVLARCFVRPVECAAQ